jgi:thiol:disulfide interchange protein DsbD
LLALVYGAGIILAFIIIGVVIGPPISEFAHHWLTNTIIAALFIAFGLSLLGLFELRLPGSLNTLASRAAGATSILGVLLLGATLVITSFACTAPFMGAVLAGGTRGGGFLEVVISMSFFGLAMALPFMILALFPSAVGSLPRSGEWMHTLKVVFGFLVLAASLYFISKVDKSQGWHALPRELFLYILSGVAFTTALYLFGLIRLKGESAEIGPMRAVFGMLILLFSLYCVYGAQGNRLGSVLGPIVPDYSSEKLWPASTGGPGGEQKAPRTIVEDDFKGGMEQARREGKLALINWTGVNCPNCRKMELTVFTRPEVMEELKKYVELRLHTDQDSALSKGLKAIKEKRLDDVSMPIYEIVDPENLETVDVFRGVGSWTAFREFLRRNAR